MPRPSSARARCGTRRRRCCGGSTSGGKAIHRYDPATGKDEVFATPEYVGCVGVRAKGGLVVALATGFYFFDPATGASTRSSTRRRTSPTPALQRRQDRPAGPLLVGHRLRGPAAADRVCRRALPPRRRPLLPPHGRGHRLLERPRLQPGRPHDVFRRQPGRLRLGLGPRPGDRRHRQPPRLHRFPPDRRLRRRRHRRRRGLLLVDAARSRESSAASIPTAG